MPARAAGPKPAVYTIPPQAHCDSPGLIRRDFAHSSGLLLDFCSLHQLTRPDFESLSKDGDSREGGLALSTLDATDVVSVDA